MNSIKDIVDRNGGMEWIPRRSPYLVSIDPLNHLVVEYAGHSPTGLPAVSVAFFNRDRGDDAHRRVIFEVTDLGWLPFHLFSKQEPMALDVYEEKKNGRGYKINHIARAQLVNICYNMDEELEVLLSPDQVVLT